MSTTNLRGEEVIYLQRALALRSGALKIDGHFGKASEAALKLFQRRHDIAPTGAVCVSTSRMLEHEAARFHLLTRHDVSEAADALLTDRAALYAVMQVETAGVGFLPDGRPKILFERHVMYRRLVAAGRDAEGAKQVHIDLVNTQAGGYAGGAAEYDRLERAMALSPDAAQESCSWGLFQIMGYHWKTLGYANVQDFVDAMRESERAHLSAFVRFVAHDKAMHAALREHDWTGFARRYNGPGYRTNAYDNKLHAAYQRFRALIDVDGA